MKNANNKFLTLAVTAAAIAFSSASHAEVASVMLNADDYNLRIDTSGTTQEAQIITKNATSTYLGTQTLNCDTAGQSVDFKNEGPARLIAAILTAKVAGLPIIVGIDDNGPTNPTFDCDVSFITFP